MQEYPEKLINRCPTNSLTSSPFLRLPPADPVPKPRNVIALL